MTFDVSTLFVADKAERTGAAQALASQSKNVGVTLFKEIGLEQAIVKVSGECSTGMGMENVDSIFRIGFD